MTTENNNDIDSNLSNFSEMELAYKTFMVCREKVDKIDGVFLVSWNFINTIMHYPDRDGYDFPSEFDKEVGFKTSKG